MSKKPKTVAKDLKDIHDVEAPKCKAGEFESFTGPGVETLKIPTLEKFIRKYEAAKEKRCAESPGELAAKKELKFALHQQRESLPLNGDGARFYRSQEYERDYVLEEKLVIKRNNTEEDDE